MKRARTAVLLRILVVVVAFATPAVVHTESASAGFTWDENAPADVTPADVTPADGWTWDDGGDAPQPAQSGS